MKEIYVQYKQIFYAQRPEQITSEYMVTMQSLEIEGARAKEVKEMGVQ